MTDFDQRGDVMSETTEPMPACRECAGGVRLIDGHPSPCPNCAEGHAWQREHGGSWDSPGSHLPPGGDVLLRRDAADAAGLPAEAFAGVPVRALLARDDLVVAACRHIVDLLNADTARARSDAQAFLDGLPRDYQMGLPERRSRRGIGRRRSEPGGPSSATPLRPPGASS